MCRHQKGEKSLEAGVIKAKNGKCKDLLFFYGDRRAVAAYCLEKRGAVYTPNALMLERAFRDGDFRRLLERASVLVPDGVGAVLLLHREGGCARRLTGVSLGMAVAEIAAERGLSLFLYGGKKGVARAAAAALKKTYPHLKISGTLDGYGDKDQAAATILESEADVVFVCLGSPLQERFIARELCGKKGRTMTAFGLGGSLDVYSGRLERAPLFFRAMGAEWLYRMVREPHRFRELPLLLSFAWRLSGIGKKDKKIVLQEK